MHFYKYQVEILRLFLKENKHFYGKKIWALVEIKKKNILRVYEEICVSVDCTTKWGSFE